MQLLNYHINNVYSMINKIKLFEDKEIVYNYQALVEEYEANRNRAYNEPLLKASTFIFIDNLYIPYIEWLKQEIKERKLENILGDNQDE